MNIFTCSPRPVLETCGLQNFNYQVDPYIGCAHYCRYCYALNQAQTDWTAEIGIHRDIAGQLAGELAQISPQKIYLGYHTDPYQPCEAQSGQTRTVLKVCLAKGFSVSILTKSALVVRDLELLRALPDAAVSVSVAFNDNRIRRQFEANTIDTEARIDALRRLKQAGITTNALICPVIPHISEVRPLIDMLAPHADKIWIYRLSIQNQADQNWLNVARILNTHFADQQTAIEQILFTTEHSYWRNLRQDLQQLQKDRQLNLDIHL